MPQGEAPYTPVPPKSGHPNFLTNAFRRLSSGGGQLASNARGGHGGICARRVLNVDKSRERCQVPELDQNKLRRVAFCVDVEIASGPRYTEDEYRISMDGNKTTNKKMTEKGEAEALKKPAQAVQQKEQDGLIQVSGEHVPKEPEKEATEATPNGEVPATVAPAAEPTTTKKKEKKKRSEEERKARKEKKRRLAEENGMIPVELMRDDSDSSCEQGKTTPRNATSPTTDPVRIYRRCCQLRETPILKKITEQVALPANIEKPGIVTKLDLTDCWLQLPDLVTLGDYLAVVPIKELIMENCGLGDEGVRVILAGLLAAPSPDQSHKRRSKANDPDDSRTRHGAVHRVVFKNNPKIGRDGWRYISLFLNMSRSLRGLDVSMIPFPQPVSSPEHGSRATSNAATNSHRAAAKEAADPAAILSKALATRMAGPELELLNMAATGLTAPQIGLLVDGSIEFELKRLGLAENNLDSAGMNHVCRFLKAGKCEGLDLGANDLSEQLEKLADALSADDHPLFALSLANCALTPEALWKLFPALAKLKNFRFIDLSNNHDIFAIKPSAVYLLRKYLPKMPMLKRIHLTNCALSPEQAIALAEIFPDATGLAHVNLLENPELAALADATDEVNQEEACALYASLMAAVRVSKSLICIDINVPSQNSSEVVKALAKQVVAYSLRNMERGPIHEVVGAVPGLEGDGLEDKEVELPEVLAHLVGREGAGSPEQEHDDETAPDEDYVIGGTGVVKALGICLKNRNTDSRRPSIDRNNSDFDPANLKQDAAPSPDGSVPSVEPGAALGRAGKAKDMSKNLLGSARKIRARLQPALLKEARTGDRMNYHKLLFLDQTLERMIQRFEDEYPETRLPGSGSASITIDPSGDIMATSSPVKDEEGGVFVDAAAEDDGHYAVGSEDEDGIISRPMLSRHNSDVSLASKALSEEEGRMHRFGQKFRRDIVSIAASTPGIDAAIDDGDLTANPKQGAKEMKVRATTGQVIENHISSQSSENAEKWAPHLEMMRAMLQEMGGEEMKRKIEGQGEEGILRELGVEGGSIKEGGSEMARRLRERIVGEDPEAWRRFVDAQDAAVRNSRLEGA